MIKPVTFFWDGEQMVPLLPFQKLCDKQFTVGEQYRLVEENERSRASHNHYFAALEEAWRNLPEQTGEEFPTSEHLRKYALIKAGYADKRTLVCTNDLEASRHAAFIKPMDAFAIVTVTECAVTVYTAQSQSMKAMGKKIFQASKDAVLDIVSSMIGVDRVQLEANARSAA